MARLQITLKDFEPWLYKWRVKINVSKTQLVCFNSRSGGSLTFCGQQVDEASKMKILGTTYDRRATGVSHCKQVAARAMSRVHLLRRLRGQTWGTSTQRLLQFYKQFVRPVMENGYAYTATAKRTSIKPLQVVQNSALRVVLKADRRTKIRDMEKATAIQPIEDRLQQLKNDAAKRYAGSSLISQLDTRLTLLAKH